VSRVPAHEERFLVLAPTGRDGELTRTLLVRAGHACAECATLSELCTRFEQEGAAALLVAEEVLAGRGLMRLREVLALQASWSDVPVLIFTGTSASYREHPASAQALASIGNVVLLDRPLRPVTMLTAARAALRARRRQYDARAELFTQLRAVRERDQFLAMLGHELRNPLSAIGMAIHLDGDAALTQGNVVQHERYRDVMRRQVAHLTRLVDDLLDVSRVTSGKIVLRRERVDMVALSQRCVAAIQPTLTGGTELSFRSDRTGPLWVHADPVRIEQVVSNLVQNAIKYSGTSGRIAVSVAGAERDALLRVEDDGVGIAPEMIDRVFDLFTQVEGSLDRAKGGMGIGLTLVRSLVGLHGGTVTAASPGIGRGSVFSVRLPLADASTRTGNHHDHTSHHEPARSLAERAQRYDVLIVEDNEDSRELLSAILARRGHRVFTAEDGLRGVEEALKRRPQVLLVDIGLPGLDGYGVARQVRGQLGDSVYIVAITGYGQPEDRRLAVQAGFDMHWTKPIDVAMIERLLSRVNLVRADRVTP